MGIWLVWSQVISLPIVATVCGRSETASRISRVVLSFPHIGEMGSAASQVLPVIPEAPKRSAPRHTNAPPTSVISENGIAHFEKAFSIDSQALLSQTLLSKLDLTSLVSRQVQIRDQQGAFEITSPVWPR